MSKKNGVKKGDAICVTIDGKECHSTFGKTILEIARENAIYVPTMCYLTKVQAIGACRMCVVEVEGVDGMILSCQEKATDGAVITTTNKSLYKERQNIMKLYNVNHPLECGVCDKSGECELQNKTMEFGVDAQAFTARDQHRPVENWGHISYDPSLCIMCEKCVRVSTEITGDEALKVKFGGYGSTIINTKKEQNYTSLGEAAAVCPVGALVNTDFKYSANAWELTQIPSACGHCSAGCQLYYEVKNERIYRVTNNAEFSNLCGAGRYGFVKEAKEVVKDSQAFATAIEKIKEADSFVFASDISNEEAMILQKIKEKYGTKLVSSEAYAYGAFLDAYTKVTGKSLYNGDLKTLSQAHAVILFGTRINDDAPMVKYHVNMASKWHRARVIYMHPMEDAQMKNLVTQFMKYEAGSEEGVSALLVDTLLRGVELPQEVRDFLDDLDIGNLSAESNLGEEEFELLERTLWKRENFSLVVGADLYTHPRAKAIATLLGLLERFAGWNVLLVPPTTNALGVSRICQLDAKAEGKTVGYGVKADFTLGSQEGADLAMPALYQQEGTLTTLDKRVVPMNVALPYGGYCLNDVANGLGLQATYTIDYTATLPTSKGFKAEAFDELPNYFDRVGVEHRGYLLESRTQESEIVLEEVEAFDGFDGAVIYRCNPTDQFSEVTAKTLADTPYLRGSEQFALVTKLSDGDEISFTVDGVTFNRVFKIDTTMKGTIALNPTFDKGLSSALLSSYRFSRLDFEKARK
jgi:NADH-quinone oxidoreductase subunit G